jgi:hypothetical protein
METSRTKEITAMGFVGYHTEIFEGAELFKAI